MNDPNLDREVEVLIAEGLAIAQSCDEAATAIDPETTSQARIAMRRTYRRIARSQRAFAEEYATKTRSN